MMERRKRILFIDDESQLLGAILRFFRNDSTFLAEVTNSPEGSLDMLRRHPYDAVVCDWRMPDMDGGTLLATIGRRYPGMPRALLTGVIDAQNIAWLVNNTGVDRVFYKPISMTELREELLGLVEVPRLGLGETPEGDKGSASIQHFVRSLVRLGMSIDPGTVEHSRRVSTLAVRVYTHLMRQRREPPEGRAALGYAALLHDLGKLFIDQRVLSKQSPLYDEQIDVLEERLGLLERYATVRHAGDHGTASMIQAIRDRMKEAVRQPDRWAVVGESVVELERKTSTLRGELDLKLIDADMEDALFGATLGTLTDRERTIIERHPVYSQQIAAGIPWGSELRTVPYLCRHHHERLDGSGYPDGLSQPYEFSTELRVLAAVDVYDAITDTNRRYRSALSPSEALEVLQSEVAKGRIDGDAVEVITWIVNNS